MKRHSLLLAVAAVLVWTAASFAAPPVLKVSGTLQPEGDLNYDVMVSEATLAAQSGADVIVSGTIAKLPANSRYWIQVGLVPKAVVDEFEAGSRETLWDQGVYVVTEDSEEGVFSLTAEDFAGQLDAPATWPVDNDGSIAFTLRLKPRIVAPAKGGTATLSVDGAPSNHGLPTLPYGNKVESDAKANEGYSPAHLVAQVLSEGGTKAVKVTATAQFVPAAVRVHHLSLYDSKLTELTKVKRGSFVNLVVSYLVASTDAGKLYKLDGTIEFLGKTQVVSDAKTKGTYAVRRTFYVPPDTKPGKQTATIKLRLLDGRTTLYSDEFTKKITVE